MCCLRQGAAVDIWLRLFNKTNRLLQFSLFVFFFDFSVSAIMFSM